MPKILKKLLLLMPIPFCIVTVTLIGDAAHIFGGGSYERKVASYLLQGNNVTGVGNYDERLLQKIYTDGVRKAPDVLVIGSSRGLQVGADLFPGQRLFNASVSGASIQDLVGVYEVYRKKNLLPKTLVLGLDPWLFNKNRDEKRWQTLREEWQAFCANAGVSIEEKKESIFDGIIPRKYHEAFSFSYFQASLSALRKTRKQTEVAPTARVFMEEGVKATDGSLYYGRKMREKTQKEIDAEAFEYVNRHPVYGLESFREMDGQAKAALEALFTALRKDGIKVVVFLAPYHPKTYSGLISSPSFRIIPQTEHYLRDLAELNKAGILGSFDPDRCGFVAMDFYDGMHPKREAVRRLFQQSM